MHKTLKCHSLKNDSAGKENSKINQVVSVSPKYDADSTTDLDHLENKTQYVHNYANGMISEAEDDQNLFEPVEKIILFIESLNTNIKSDGTSDKPLPSKTAFHYDSSSKLISELDQEGHSSLPLKEDLFSVSNEKKDLSVYNCSDKNVCKFCGYAPKYWSTLKKHLTLHSGQKPFKCDQCDYSSHWKHLLINHKMKHSGEWKYKCSYCNYRNNNSTNYKRHLKWNHPGKAGLYICPVCQFWSINEKIFTLHLFKMHKIGPDKNVDNSKNLNPEYNCKICSFTTKFKSTFHRHLRFHKGLSGHNVKNSTGEKNGMNKATSTLPNYDSQSKSHLDSTKKKIQYAYNYTIGNEEIVVKDEEMQPIIELKNCLKYKFNKKKIKLPSIKISKAIIHPVENCITARHDQDTCEPVEKIISFIQSLNKNAWKLVGTSNNSSPLESKPSFLWNSLSSNVVTECNQEDSFISSNPDLLASSKKHLLVSSKKNLLVDSTKKILAASKKKLFVDSTKKMLAASKKNLFVDSTKKLLAASKKKLFTYSKEGLLADSKKDLFTNSKENLIADSNKVLLANSKENLLVGSKEDVLASYRDKKDILFYNNCRFCGYAPKSWYTLKKHLILHSGQKPFKCDQCDYSTYWQHLLRNHKMIHSGEYKYKCHYCYYRNNNSSNYKKHLQVYHPGKAGLYTCRLCSFWSINVKLFTLHLRKMHNIPNISSDNQMNSSTKDIIHKYNGNSCSYSTKYESSLGKNLQMQKKLNCHDLQSDFAKKINSEMVTVTRTSKYIADSTTDLDYAEREKHKFYNYTNAIEKDLHTQEETQSVTWNEKKGQSVYNCSDKNVCKFCGYAPKYWSTLKKHLTLHSGQKPFKCDQCDYSSYWKHLLINHKMKHSGEWKYKCSYCNYRNNNSTNYKRHLKWNHPGKAGLYICPVCQFWSINEKLFTLHLFKVHKIDPGKNVDNSKNLNPEYNCKICSFTTKFKSTFHRHLRFHKGLSGHNVKNSTGEKNGMNKATSTLPTYDSQSKSHLDSTKKKIGNEKTIVNNEEMKPVIKFKNSLKYKFNKKKFKLPTKANLHPVENCTTVRNDQDACEPVEKIISFIEYLNKNIWKLCGTPLESKPSFLCNSLSSKVISESNPEDLLALSKHDLLAFPKKGLIMVPKKNLLKASKKNLPADSAKILLAAAKKKLLEAKKKILPDSKKKILVDSIKDILAVNSKEELLADSKSKVFPDSKEALHADSKKEVCTNFKEDLIADSNKVLLANSKEDLLTHSKEGVLASYRDKKDILYNNCSKRNSCSFCGYAPKSWYTLKNHLNIHTNQKSFKCDQCDYSTAWKHLFKKHKRKHLGELKHKCHYCNYHNNNSSNYKKHLQVHHPGKAGLYSCPLCTFWSIDGKVLTLHLHKMHNIPNISTDNQMHGSTKDIIHKFNSNSYSHSTKCKSILGKNLQMHKELNCHDLQSNFAGKNNSKRVKVTNISSKYIADSTNNLDDTEREKQNFSNFANVIEDDVLTHEKTLSVIQNEFSKYKCQVKLTKKVLKPIKNFTSVKKFITFSGFSVNLENIFREYTSKNENPEAYVCDYCSYNTSVKHLIELHLAIHSGEKFYKCSFCPNGYFTNSIRSYRSHVFSSNHPFKLTCAICSVSFYNNKHFTEHTCMISVAENVSDNVMTAQVIPNKSLVNDILNRKEVLDAPSNPDETIIFFQDRGESPNNEMKDDFSSIATHVLTCDTKNNSDISIETVIVHEVFEA